MTEVATSTKSKADARRLVGWKVPEVRHRYTRRDVAFYALSLGAGQSPLATEDHVFVDPWSDCLTMLPSMPLVLGYPGFWLGEPQVRELTGVAPANVLHAQQGVEIDGALPVEGDVIGRTRVFALQDKGAGNGALLYSERSIVDAASGAPLARCTQVHFLRGAGGCGNEGDVPDKPLACAPSTAPDCTHAHATRIEQALLYRLNGDANPLHCDPLFARSAGFERPILHGMCTAGIAMLAVVKSLADGDATRVASMTLRMKAPVLPGDTLVTHMWRDGSFHTTAHERGVEVIQGGQALLRLI